MAKSLYEPKKLTRYTDSVSGGNSIIASRPIPAAAAAISSPTPPPAPTPVVVNTPPIPPTPETKALQFNGSTFLTGSYPSTLGTKPFWDKTYSVTFTPGWNNTATCSFAIDSVSNVDGVADEGFNLYVQRTSGSDGYKQYVGTEYIKGDIVRSNKRLLSNTLASGSTLHLQVMAYAGSITHVKENNTFNNNRNTPTGYGNTASIQGSANRNVATGSYTIAIGGTNSFSHASGSQASNFVGTIANIQIRTYSGGLNGSPVTSAQYDSTDTLVAYKFEGIVSASVGDSNLDVIGTQSYLDFA